MRTKVRKRGAARGWECGRKCADGAKPGRAVGRESAQAWGGWEVGIRAKVRRWGKAGSWGWAQKCADGAKPGRAVGRESGFGCARYAHRTPSELIGTKRNLSEGLGSLLICSDRLR